MEVAAAAAGVVAIIRIRSKAFDEAQQAILGACIGRGRHQEGFGACDGCAPFLAAVRRLPDAQPPAFHVETAEPEPGA